MECDNNKVEIGVRMHYYINEIGHSNTLTASKYIREACELKNVLKSENKLGLSCANLS